MFYRELPARWVNDLLGMSDNSWEKSIIWANWFQSVNATVFHRLHWPLMVSALPKAVLTQVLNILTLSSNTFRKYLLSPHWAFSCLPMPERWKIILHYTVISMVYHLMPNECYFSFLKQKHLILFLCYFIWHLHKRSQVTMSPEDIYPIFAGIMNHVTDTSLCVTFGETRWRFPVSFPGFGISDGR